jgi:hypothetical protein
MRAYSSHMCSGLLVLQLYVCITMRLCHIFEESFGHFWLQGL